MFTNRGTASTSGILTGRGLPIVFDADTYTRAAPRNLPSIPAVAQDLILRGLVARDFAPTAICELLGIERKDLNRRLLLCGLTRPKDRKVRKRNKNGWRLSEERALIRYWERDYTTSLIAELLSRSANAVQAKARRFGLHSRDRRLLISSAPSQESWKVKQSRGRNKRASLTDDALREVRERWVRRQSAEGIVLDLGLDMTPGALSAKASRVGLPHRGGHVCLMIDRTGAPDAKLDANAQELKCDISGKIFFGTRHQRWSPTTRTSETLRSIINADGYGLVA